MELSHPDMAQWKDMAHQVDSFTDSVSIALIGKYTGFQDSYLSVIKNLKVRPLTLIVPIHTHTHYHLFY